MELGEKIRLARQEQGLSQRQLCGEEITRNMLSLIEHGSARPSMDTLRYLAGRLGKPMSYFLEEDSLISPNQQSMLQARKAWQEGNWQEARLLLENFQAPDPIFQWEYDFLLAATALVAAEEAIKKGKSLYARELLLQTEVPLRDFPGMERQRLLLLARLKDAELAQIAEKLPSIDEELQIRAKAILEKDPVRSGQLLDAMEEKTSAQWFLLRGQSWLNQKQYAKAAECFRRGEGEAPKQTAPLLERCYRELGDYKRAYEYALKQR